MEYHQAHHQPSHKIYNTQVARLQIITAGDTVYKSDTKGMDGFTHICSSAAL